MGTQPQKSPFESLPSISQVDKHLAGQGLPSGKSVRDIVQGVLQGFRDALKAGHPAPPREEVLEKIALALTAPPANQLRAVINATGVVVHTNLGRAPLSPEVLQGVLPLLSGYTNLEFDLSTGKRGERGGRVPQLLTRLSGAESALVVNNNAAAVLLMLTALSPGKEVIVSRGELVEIGGSFRVPDIMAQSGAKLVEVGTTNRTRVSDYAKAITPDTAGLLKVHRSNFEIKGFVEEASVEELAKLGAEKKIPVWNDLGSGNFYRFEQPALKHLFTVEQEMGFGPDVLTFSGDKLLGSVQAGIVVGAKEPLEKMRKHPLYRSLRVDKVRMALLEQSLLDYLSFSALRARNPVIDGLERTPEEMAPLAEKLVALLKEQDTGEMKWQVAKGQSLPGGGALPEVKIETLTLALTHPKISAEALSAKLRANEPPVIARISTGKVLLDFRTLQSKDLPLVAEAISKTVQ